MSKINKVNQLLVSSCIVLLIISSVLLINYNTTKKQLEIANTDRLISVARLEGESENWKISDGVLVNTSNQIHLNFESIEYIGSDDDVSEELIVNIKFIDKRTGKTEETVIGYSFNKVDLKDYKVSNIGGMSPREMMDYYDHDILVEIEYSNKIKEKFIEEIEVKPTWNFESNKTIGQNDNVRITQLI